MGGLFMIALGFMELSLLLAVAFVFGVAIGKGL